ncbi:hypothetical protein FRZ44_18020 [Hypericibacter terrae]|uniref:Uncharacterized protein n=1 Tax=Hypericibacter terrae TaxID=2602015 RepID=A0A5J6MHA7_9PROT|nr:hypothetical protein FRZ44_18020 [Hypericibacter terrae]
MKDRDDIAHGVDAGKIVMRRAGRSSYNTNEVTSIDFLECRYLDEGAPVGCDADFIYRINTQIKFNAFGRPLTAKTPIPHNGHKVE